MKRSAVRNCCSRCRVLLSSVYRAGGRAGGGFRGSEGTRTGVRKRR